MIANVGQKQNFHDLVTRICKFSCSKYNKSLLREAILYESSEKENVETSLSCSIMQCV